MPRNEPIVIQQLEDADEFFISSTVLGELFYGAYHSQNIEHNLSCIETLLSESGLIACDQATARHYGQTKAELRRQGRPIPENDVWIAASAKQHSLTLVSRDDHFRYVTGLTVVQW